MKSFEARLEILKYSKPFTTTLGPYTLIFEPKLLGSIVYAQTSYDKTSWLLSEAPAEVIVALGQAARKLNINVKK